MRGLRMLGVLVLAASCGSVDGSGLIDPNRLPPPPAWDAGQLAPDGPELADDADVDQADENSADSAPDALDAALCVPRPPACHMCPDGIRVPCRGGAGTWVCCDVDGVVSCDGRFCGTW
jgi:hypothetical protein